MMPTKFREHTGYTYADCVSLTESRIFCRADSSEHGIWRDRYLIKQAIEILWYAGSMVVFSNGHEVEFTQEDIRQSLLLELDLEKIKSAFGRSQLPPGCGSMKLFAVNIFLSMPLCGKAFCAGEELLKSEKIFVYGLGNKISESEAEYRVRIYTDEERKYKTFCEAITSLRAEVEKLKEHRSLKEERERESLGRFFSLPNNIFHLGLDGGEILVYAYLRYCEDRKTYKCHPSFATIGEAVGMSKKTVEKYVRGLEDKRLITTDRTTVKTKDGRIRNGSLEYHIRPIQEAVDCYDERQMAELYRQKAMSDAQKRLDEYDRKHGRTEAPENTVQ